MWLSSQLVSLESPDESSASAHGQQFEQQQQQKNSKDNPIPIHMQAEIMGRTHKETIHILATLFDSLTRHSLYHSLSGDLRRKKGKEKEKNDRTKE